MVAYFSSRGEKRLFKNPIWRYAPQMGKSSSVLLSLLPWLLIGCHSVSRTAAPVPESQQVIGGELKNLYMATSAAAPRSPEQQKLIAEMAAKASNGKELLLVMRASEGVFPPAAASSVRSTVTARMMQVATLDQLSDFAARYGVDPPSARPFLDRMFQLGAGSPDPRTWHTIRLAAARLRQPDLEREAAARAARQ
jgi:hypothetical protein